MTKERAIATIGFFDGVHKGHQYVLAELVKVASKEGLSPLVITFKQHPRHILRSEPLPLLCSPKEREQLILNQGIKRVEMLDFEQIRALTAKEFMMFIHEELSVDSLLIGYNHRFGSDKLQHFQDYQTIAQQVGLTIKQLSKYESEGQKCSSTAIRQLLQEGDIAKANSLLGYEYSIEGQVVEGHHIGRQIGFPTANIEPSFAQQLIPKRGVYSARTKVEQTEYQCIVNIGNNPTFGREKETIEVHLLDYEGDLYENKLRIYFTQYIREDRHFASAQELKEQISRDIEQLQLKGTSKNSPFLD